MIESHQWLQDLPQNKLDEELFQTIVSAPHFRVEKIVSTGHSSPADFWYDQDEHEWVLVLKGATRLRIEGESEARKLNAGDSLLLPAHTRHRVEWTSEEPTVWLAIFYGF